MNTLRITDATQQFTPQVIEDTELLVITNITESTLNNAITIARTAREKGIVTAGISAQSDLNIWEFMDTVIISKAKTEDITNAISGLINGSGFVNLDIEDLRRFFKNAGTVYFGQGIAKDCTDAAKKAVEMLGDVKSAKGILLNITTSFNVALGEMSDAAQIICDTCKEDTSVVWGHVIDDDSDMAKVTAFMAVGGTFRS